MSNEETRRRSNQALDGQTAVNALFAPRGADLRASPELRAARAAAEGTQPPAAERLASATSTEPQIVVSGVRPFNINSFRNEIAGRGVLPTHSFILFINGNFISPESNAYNYQNRMIAMRCESVSIPGVNLLLQDVTRFGYGPITRMPHAAQYNTLTMNFIVDENGGIHKFFNDWTNRIVNHKSKGGSEMTVANDRGMFPYQVGYKKDYAIPQMSLIVADRKQANVIECLFFDAFPIIVNDVNLSWGEQDTPMRLSVSMSFTDVEFTYPFLEEGPLATSDFDPAAESTPAQAKAKRSLLGKLSNNVGRLAAQSVVDGIVESTERSFYRIFDNIF